MNLRLKRIANSVLALVLTLILLPTSNQGAPAFTPGEWRPLFDGTTLNGWQATDFGGHGEVRTEKGEVRLGAGVALTGITWTNDLPKTNYEVSVQAMKIDGSDFFCAITFPVGATAGTLVVGGWGGTVVGVSSIDGLDASENETTQYIKFDPHRWYSIRLRVTQNKIIAWIDHERVVDVSIKDRRLALRPGEIYLSQPFGIATWQTTSVLRDLKMRPLGGEKKGKKIVLIAGKKSHAPGEHEYEDGVRLLADSFDQADGLGEIETEVCLNGWPADAEVLEEADSVLFYCDGADRSERADPFLREQRLATFDKLAKRGLGLVAIHYTLFQPASSAGTNFLDWLGGYFDYETGTATNHWYSRIETKDYDLSLVTPGHPISRGLAPFRLHDELYSKIRFLEPDKRRVPILAFGSDTNDPSAIVAWAVERVDSGRGFAYTGGHFHRNWELENVRRMILNALLWTAKAEVPEGGVRWSGSVKRLD